MVMNEAYRTPLTIEMGEVVHICHDVVCIVWELLQTKLKYPEGNVLVLGAVVFHEGSANIHMKLCPHILSCLLEHFSCGLDALGSPRKLHVLQVGLGDISIMGDCSCCV